MALVATVLLAVLAATIVLVIASQAVNANHAESIRSDAAQAAAAAQNAKAALVSSLQSNPYFFYSTVFTATVNGQTFSERARVCQPTSSTIQPGSSWSLATCGPSWTYVSASTTPTAWLEITPPSLNSPDLSVQILATIGNASSGLTLNFRLSGSDQFSLWSSSSLNLNQMPSAGPQQLTGCPPACSSVSGSVYTAGTFTFPASATQPVSILDAQLEAEQGFTSSPTDVTSRYYAQTSATSSTPPIQQIRNVVPEVLTTQALQSVAQLDYSIACPGGTPFYSSTTATSSSLCLSAGSTVVTGPATTAVLPASVAAYLIVLNGGAKTASIWYTTSSPAASIDASCQTSTCDLLNQGTTDVNANSSPGVLSYWTSGSAQLLGTGIPLPQTGLIFADHDVYLGICSTGVDANWNTANGVCPSLTGASDPGMLVGNSVTILAGTPTSPANVYLGSSIETSSTASFGVIATGSLKFPYWAHSPGSTSASTQLLEGAYTALGFGVDPSITSIAGCSGSVQSGPVTTFPSCIDSTNADNVASELDIVGSLAAPDLNLSFPTFGVVTIANQTQLNTAPPPFYTNFSGGWSLVSTTPLTAAQVCGSGSLTCPGM